MSEFNQQVHNFGETKIMSAIVKKLFLGASLAASVTALNTTSAFAASLTNPNAIGTDIYKYSSTGTKTYLDSKADVSTLLMGNSSAPGGNIELFAKSERLSNEQFKTYTEVTSLTGKIGGKDLTISSLTYADWMSDVGGGITLVEKWMTDALNAFGLSPALKSTLLPQFIAGRGLQAFSDGNISYVNQDEKTGEIKIGLAGHLNSSIKVKEVLIASNLPTLASLVPDIVQASELIKVSYDGGPAQYLYSFSATNSGQVNAGDKRSHSGNYEVTVATVPEPATMLGVMAVGGLLAASKRRKFAGNA